MASNRRQAGTAEADSPAREWQIGGPVANCRSPGPVRRSVIHPVDVLEDILHRITAGPTLAYAILVLALILAPKIAVGLVVLGVWSLVALPRVARWFFAHVGTDRSYRFVFGIAAFLVGAVMAEAAGIDGIVGAFFAGLGLNRAVPEQSPLMNRLQFMGSTFFIPIFLVSVGVLLDPRVMVDPKTLGVALVFTVAVLGGKSLAAIIAGRTFHFTWPEIGVMSGLSGSQAAATLATTLVGAKLGLFDKQTINAVLVVILSSLVVTPARFLVALAAHEETTFHRREERVAGPVVTGRSLKPHPA